MITGLNVTIGVFVLVLVFGLILYTERKVDGKKAKKTTTTPKELAKVVQTGAVEVRLESKMTPTERWDAHVERLSN